MKVVKHLNNQAFIDGQNLYLGTTQNEYGDEWKVDLFRFRRYLAEKYGVTKAYYFLGAINEDYQEIYELIQTAGFILLFREHSQAMIGKKKGNVDTDIVYTIMRKLVKQEEFDKVILVSGDGDYIKMVKFLISEQRFAKLLALTKAGLSSLYRHQISNDYYDFLDDTNIKSKIQYHPKPKSKSQKKPGK